MHGTCGVAQVSDILARREEEELKAIARMNGEEVEEEVVAAVAARKSPKGRGKAEVVAAPEPEKRGPPPAPGVTLTTTPTGPSAPHSVLVRFVVLVNGKVKRYVHFDGGPQWLIAAVSGCFLEPHRVPFCKWRDCWVFCAAADAAAAGVDGHVQHIRSSQWLVPWTVQGNGH